MRLGIGLGLGSRYGGSASAPFTPLTLFSGGQTGGYYDPSNLTKVWQASDGTTPGVVASPVGRLDDLSGNGNHLVRLSADAKRPTLAAGYLTFDGVDDAMQATFTLAQTWTRISRVKIVTWADNARLLDGGVNLGGVLFMFSATPNIAMFAGGFGPQSTAMTVGAFATVVERFSGATSRLSINGGAYVTGDAGTNAGAGLTLGSAGDGFYPGNVQIGRVIVRSGDLTDPEIAAASTWVAS